MSQPHALSCHQGVDRPYDPVAALLRGRPFELLQRATTAAAARAASAAANLRVEVAGVDLGVNVRLWIRNVRDTQTDAGASPALCVELSWEAVRTPALFPAMLAQLLAWPLSPSKTQLEIRGAYWTPLGPLGSAIDAAIGHRIAEAAVQHFLEDIVTELQRELPDTASPKQHV